MGQLAQPTAPSQAAVSCSHRRLQTAAAPPHIAASSSKNHPDHESDTEMGSTASTPVNDMQQAAHQEAAGAFPLPSAPPMPPPPRTQASKTRSGSKDPNISNSSTYKDPPSKRKAHGSAQASGPKRAKIDDTKLLAQNIGSLAINSNMTAADEPVDHIAIVKQWLAEREARPSPLTPAELNAIITLKATLGRIPAPELGVEDWISRLHRYKDARQQFAAGFEFEETTNEDKSFSAVCIFTGEQGIPPLRFPGEHGGLLPVDHSGTLGVPTFLKKKDAKRYAAKCCVEWLMANGYMPADGSTASLSKIKPKPFRIPSTDSAAPAAQPNGDSTTASNGATVASQGNTIPTESRGDMITTSRPVNGTPRPANDTVAKPPSNPVAKPPSNPVAKPPSNPVAKPPSNPVAKPPSNPVPTATEEETSDSEVPATQRVKELCETLGLCQPQYIITASPHGRDFFDGRVNFLADDPYFEDGVGRVFGGYTRKGTKERVAEQVLLALLEIAAKREAACKVVLGGEEARD